jgi:hypothetical protein
MSSKGLSRSVYRNDSILLNVAPNLMANGLRWLVYKMLGNTQKAYRTEGRILKYCGYIVGKSRIMTGAGTNRGKQKV